MGYFSNAMIGLSVLDNDRSYPSELETLLYFLEDLTAKLEELDEIRPHDPMDPEYDKYFYSDGLVHYYENPSTVQDVLFALRELEAKFRDYDVEVPVTEFYVIKSVQMGVA